MRLVYCLSDRNSIALQSSILDSTNPENFAKTGRVLSEIIGLEQIVIRRSAIADASCQLKSCQLPRISAETCMTSPEQIEVMKLEGYSWTVRKNMCTQP